MRHFVVRSVPQGLALIQHPAIARNFAKALRWRPKNELAVLVPCAGTKPFPEAPSHKRGYLAALEGKDADLWVVSEPLGVVPYEWSRAWPNDAYDFPPRYLRGEAWDALVERVAEWLEKVAPKYRRVFVALPGHHERLLRAALELHDPGNLKDATHSRCLDSGACPSGHGRATSSRYRRFLGTAVRNPDEDLRRLEREAATGDLDVRSRLARGRQRAGAAAWDDPLWAMSDEDLILMATYRIQGLERDAQRLALTCYSAWEREVLDVALRRRVLTEALLERLREARAKVDDNWADARSRARTE